MTDGSAETGRIGARDSILEARAELGCAPLEGDTIFESPHGHHFSVLKRDELNGAEGARGHLAEVGEDARSHPGGAGAFARLHVIGCRIHHTLVFGVLDRLVGLDRGGGKAIKGVVISVSTCNAFGYKLLPREGEGLGQLGGRRGVDNTDVDPQLSRQYLDDAVNSKALEVGGELSNHIPDSGFSSSLGGRGGANHRGQEKGRLEACNIRFKSGRRGWDFGVEEASLLAGKGRTHHHGGGGVGGRISTGFTDEGLKDFLDTPRS